MRFTFVFAAFLIGVSATEPEESNVAADDAKSWTNQAVCVGVLCTLDKLSRGCIAKEQRTLVDVALALTRSCVLMVTADRVACAITSDPNPRSSDILPTLVRAAVYAWLDASGCDRVQIVPTVFAILFQESFIGVLKGWKAEERLAQLGRRMVSPWSKREEDLCNLVEELKQE